MDKYSIINTKYNFYLCLMCLVLIIIVFAVYAQVENYQFFAFDENDGVTNNAHVAGGLTRENIVWAFTSVEACNWHPLTWLSHITIAELYGMRPGAHHIANVVIHTISSVLLLLLLFRLTGKLWQSSFVAYLFALHPLHVESVAWVAERKDVLSAFFGFLTLLFYAEYVVKRKPKMYISSLFFFILGLMSKPMLVTLPIVMLFIDFWPLSRYSYEKSDNLIRFFLTRLQNFTIEKIPFIAFSLLSVSMTIYAQNKSGAISSLEKTHFWLRTENALVSYVKYICKSFWPHDLAVLYPSLLSFPIWQVIGSIFVLLLFSTASLWAVRRCPYIAVGWFWFLITLVPVIGLIKVGSQSMADRYTYIPLIGLFIIVAWGVSDLTEGLRHRVSILALLSVTVISISTVLTWQQLSYWRNSITILRHSLKVTTGNYMLNNFLGVEYANIGALDAAIKRFQEALRINSNDPTAHNNLGRALASEGNLEAAINEYKTALSIDPNLNIAQKNMDEALAVENKVNRPLINSPVIDFKKILISK